MDKEKEVIDAEATEATDEKKDKKPNIFARAWNKTKDSVSSSILEGKIESAYREESNEYQVYTKDALLSQTVYGTMNGNELTIFGKPEIKAYSIIIENSKKDNNPAYFAIETKETTVKSVVEGVEYERPGTIISLDSDVTEVNVIKAGKRYFIYKGPNKE